MSATSDIVEAMKAGTVRVLAAIHAEQLDAANAEIERLERLVYVPGVWVCAKCKLSLISTLLDVSRGLFAANKEPQQCPNGCGPLWRKTERDAGNELCIRVDELAMETVSPNPQIHEDTIMALEVTKEFHFDAAHRLDRLPATHKCHNLHGHTYRVWVTVRGGMDQDIGWVQDFAEISGAIDPVLKEKFDHKYLNDTLPCITTAENIAQYLYVSLIGKLPLLYSIEVAEGLKNKVRYCPGVL